MGKVGNKSMFARLAKNSRPFQYLYLYFIFEFTISSFLSVTE